MLSSADDDVLYPVLTVFHRSDLPGPPVIHYERDRQRLSKEEKDVSKELEAYRQSLLRYRYEQRYINERLDTTVSKKQIDEYYGSHKESFKLERPILKARFMNIPKDSPNLQKIKKLMSSDKVEDVVAADSIAFNSTQRYHDYSNGWIDAVKLAAEFGVDYVQIDRVYGLPAWRQPPRRESARILPCRTEGRQRRRPS